MFRAVTPFVVFHWAALFSLLAFLCVMAGDGGATRVLSLMGLEAGRLPVMPPSAALILSLMLAVCAVLFWWALLASVVGDREWDRSATPVTDTAFAVACATLTVILFCGILHGIDGLLPAIAVEICALLVSYVAVSLGGRGQVTDRAAREQGRVEAVRKRVGEASHAASLVRLSARQTAIGSN